MVFSPDGTFPNDTYYFNIDDTSFCFCSCITVHPRYILNEGNPWYVYTKVYLLMYTAMRMEKEKYLT